MGKVSIVIVDEDNVFLELMEMLLTTHGYTAVCCKPGPTTHRLIRQAQPKLVILDVRAGADDACWNVLDLLRLSPETTRIPVLVCSINNEFLKAKSEYFEMLGIATQEKPFRLSDLLLKVEREIGPPDREVDRAY